MQISNYAFADIGMKYLCSFIFYYWFTQEFLFQRFNVGCILDKVNALLLERKFAFFSCRFGGYFISCRIIWMAQLAFVYHKLSTLSKVAFLSSFWYLQDSDDFLYDIFFGVISLSSKDGRRVRSRASKDGRRVCNCVWFEQRMDRRRKYLCVRLMLRQQCYWFPFQYYIYVDPHCLHIHLDSILNIMYKIDVETTTLSILLA